MKWRIVTNFKWVIFNFQVWDLLFTVYMVYIFVMYMCYI